MKRWLLAVLIAVALGVAVAAGLSNHAVLDQRSEEGQIAFLKDTFELSECDSLSSIGAMYRDAGDEFTHRTAFSADEACLDELMASARARGFVERDAGEFVSPRENGYHEKLVVSEGGAFEWERAQE